MYLLDELCLCRLQAAKDNGLLLHGQPGGKIFSVAADAATRGAHNACAFPWCACGMRKYPAFIAHRGGVWLKEQALAGLLPASKTRKSGENSIAISAAWRRDETRRPGACTA
jgi:hypothetical protein